MDLSYTAEQQELKDAVRRFCAEEVTPERLAAWDREPRGIDARCWQTIAELGWLGLGLPASAGGSGLGLVEVACVLEECGRGLIPRVVISAVRGGWALAQLEPGAPELNGLAAAQQTVTVALDEERGRDPSGYQVCAEPAGDTLRLRGSKWYVSSGPYADYHIVG